MGRVDDFKVVELIIRQHSSYIHIYGFNGFKKRGINTQKISKKLKELYGEYLNGHQFIEFGEKYLDAYLKEKHNITFKDILIESFEPILHRFRHLV